MVRLLIKNIINKIGYTLSYKGTVAFGNGISPDTIDSIDFSKQVFDNQDEALEIIRIAAKYTMCSLERLFTLYNLTKYLETKKISGDFVECGVWKGGSVGVMAFVNNTYNKTGDRKIWMYDTFEGLPKPVFEDGNNALEYFQIAKKTNNEKLLCKANESFVTELLDSIDFPEKQRRIEKGLFQDTLLNNKPDKIALLRLDGDWYESTKVCLEQLYDKLEDGGVIIIDDYGAWAGCKKAVDEFFYQRGISPFLHHVDFTCRYFFKIG
jgi:O-methyltransferase